MDRTVDGDVQLDTRTNRDLDAAARPAAVSQHVLGAGSEAQGPPEAATYQVVVACASCRSVFAALARN